MQDIDGTKAVWHSPSQPAAPALLMHCCTGPSRVHTNLQRTACGDVMNKGASGCDCIPMVHQQHASLRLLRLPRVGLQQS